MDITGIGGIAPVDLNQAEKGVNRSTGGSSFGKVLNESLGEVNKLQAKADEAVEALATGKGVSLHETMIALEKADLSFRLMMQVRNKIVAAYQEVMGMAV